MGLPFLVVHGAILWKLALAALVGATFGVGHALRARGVRRSARIARDVLLREASNPKLGPVVLRGKITAGTATTLARRLATQDAQAALTLDCGGEVIEIDATISVEQGAVARARWRQVGVEHSVGPGDEVLAAGVLAEQPGEARSYRETQIRYRLTGDPAVRIIAIEPRLRPFPLRLGQLGVALVLVVPIWYGALCIVGKAALHAAQDPGRGTARDGELPSFGAAELAAAMPISRDDALEALDEQLAGFRLPVTERALELQVELADLRGRCRADILERQVRLEPALDAARRCGTHKQVVGLLAFLGRFAEAEHELADGDISELATTIRIATGKWDAAARGVDARAEELEHRLPLGDPSGDAYVREAAAQLRCVGALLRSYAGDRDAFSAVRDRGKGHGCAIVQAASLPIAEQPAAFAAIHRSDADTLTSAGYELIADGLAYAAGAPRDRYEHGDGASALIFQFDQARIWLAPFQLAAHPDDAIAHENMTAVAVLRGDLADAHAHLARASTGGGSEYIDQELALGVALREPGPIAVSSGMETGLEEALALRRGTVPERLQEYMDHRDSPFRDLIGRAVAGDGEALALALREDYLQWQAFAVPLFGILPRITSHRDAAIAAVRMFRNDLTTFGTDHLPFRALSDMIAYRDAARLVGDAEDAKQWQAIVDRYLAVLGDRQKLVALLFWTD